MARKQQRLEPDFASAIAEAAEETNQLSPPIERDELPPGVAGWWRVALPFQPPREIHAPSGREEAIEKYNAWAGIIGTEHEYSCEPCGPPSDQIAA